MTDDSNPTAGQEEIVPLPPTGFYVPSRIKRHRATKSEVEDRRSALYRLLFDCNPMTVRQVFYQASVRGIVEKTEAGYTKVQTDLVFMRKEGMMPYSWLADATRWMRRTKSHDSFAHALYETAKFYRKNLWTKNPSYVEVWIEKDALAGIVFDVTEEYDVPLMSARGYASLSFMHSSAEAITAAKKPAFIYHLGDFDPSGVNAAETIGKTLREMAPRADIHFQRVAVTPMQIEEWNLPTRPTKTTDSRAKTFGSDVSVELDAIDPDMLRALVQACIEQHISEDELRVLKAAEESERGILGTIFKDAVESYS